MTIAAVPGGGRARASHRFLQPMVDTPRGP